MTKWRRLPPWFAAGFVLALLLGACGDDQAADEPEDEPEVVEEDGDPEPEPEDEPEEEPEPELAEACQGLRVGIAGPFTGDAAAIGQEQLNWGRFALERFNEEHGTDFELVEADTQLDPAQATTVAQQFISDDSLLAVAGPAGSPEAEAVGPIFEAESLAYIGMSATRPDLTDGSYPTFFRVVPNDDAQGPRWRTTSPTSSVPTTCSSSTTRAPTA